MRLVLALFPGALALLQHARDSVGRVDASRGLLRGRIRSLLKARPRWPAPAYDCRRHPHMCKPPFNCQTANATSILPVAVNGHANLQSWCDPEHEEFVDNLVQECLVKHDLKASALAVFDTEVRLGIGELDASYCFIEGHCTNEGINDSTTLEEAEEACDRRYGRTGWREDWSDADNLALAIRVRTKWLRNPFYVPGDIPTGFHEQKMTRLFAKVACSMGNFHCDVQYCKHTYCKIGHYRKRYEHLLPATPGHEIVDLSAWQRRFPPPG